MSQRKKDLLTVRRRASGDVAAPAVAGVGASVQTRPRPHTPPWWRAVIAVIKPTMTVFTRRRWYGQENIPAQGPVLLVPNHISNIDPLVLGFFVYESRRLTHFLAKAELFDGRLGPLMRGVGHIPVDRGGVSAATSLEPAADALRRGDLVVVYPEGTITRDPRKWPMQGKTGIARLALETGVPVVPVAQWGAQEVLPYGKGERLHLLPRKQVTVVAGPPVDLSAWQGRPLTADVLREVTDEIMRHVREMLGEIRGETPPQDVWTPRREAQARREERARASASGAAAGAEPPAAPVPPQPAPTGPERLA